MRAASAARTCPPDPWRAGSPLRTARGARVTTPPASMKEWSTFSRFPCTAEEYYALMLDGDFQRKVHLEGLKMGRYDVTDDPHPDGTVRRVVFSEPKLNLPAVLERVMKRAQAYHEHAVFDPSKLDRRVKVVPCIGAERIDFSFHETVRPDEDGVGGCVVEALVRVRVQGGWLGRILERFVCSTSKIKIAERDAHLNAHFRAVGFDTFDGVERVDATNDDDVLDETPRDHLHLHLDDAAPESSSVVTVTVGAARVSDPGARRTNANANAKPMHAPALVPARMSASESLDALRSHPLAPSPPRSTWRRMTRASSGSTRVVGRVMRE